MTIPAQPAPIRVLVVDDQSPFRLAAKAVLRRLDGFELAGEATSAREAIELVDSLRPALVQIPGRLVHRRVDDQRPCSIPLNEHGVT